MTTGKHDRAPLASLTLRTRFLLIVLAIFIGGASASYGVINWFTRDVVHTLAGWFAEKSVLYEKSKVLQLLLREITLTQKMASSPQLRDWIRNERDPVRLKNAMEELEDYRTFYRGHNYFFAIRASGNYYFNDDKGGHSLQEPRYTLSAAIPKDGWFYETLRHVKDYQLNVDTDRHLGVTKVWINTVLREGAQALAVIGTGVELTDFITSVVNSSQAGVTNILLDRNGAVQAHQDVSIIDFASISKRSRHEQQSTIFNLIDGEEQRESMRRVLADLAAGQGDVRSMLLSIQGMQHVAGVAYLPDIKWFLVTLTYPESAHRTYYVGTVALVLVVSLAATLLIAGFIFDRVVLRRLAALDVVAGRIAAGDYRARPGIGGNDELGRLAQGFSAMGERIAAHTTELEKQIAERTSALERLAYADYLTGLLNRRGMLDRIDIEKNRLRRHGGNLGVMLLDIDKFKSINDRYGHGVGDQALVRCANLLREAVRSYDLCARWGGEEFLIIVPDIASADALVQIAEKLRETIQNRPLTLASGAEVPMTASIGCCVAAPDMSIDAVLRTADGALYRAKQEGRNRVVLASERGGSEPPVAARDA